MTRLQGAVPYLLVTGDTLFAWSQCVWLDPLCLHLEKHLRGACVSSRSDRDGSAGMVCAVS